MSYTGSHPNVEKAWNRPEAQRLMRDVKAARKRMQQIDKLRNEGWAYVDLAVYFGISGSRVRQLHLKHKQRMVQFPSFVKGG